jgi:3-oxoacyl-[acyl-carrier protein] reductase
MSNFNGKVAVVTGSAKGIGAEIAREFSQKGASVVLTDVNKQNLDAIFDELKKTNTNVLAILSDISKFNEAQHLIEKTTEKFEKIDILVNNAGITRDNLLMRMSEEEWDQVITTNLKGTFNCIKAVTRAMIKQRYGRIINISSVVGLMGNAGQTNYAASKAGVIGVTKSVARELASRNITCNAIAPGFIETDMTAILGEKVVEGLKSQIPLGRLGSMKDVANLVCFLASDDAAYITGQVVNVDGGMVMY